MDYIMERVVQFLKEARQSMLDAYGKVRGLRDVIDYRTMDYYQRRYMAGKE